MLHVDIDLSEFHRAAERTTAGIRDELAKAVRAGAEAGRDQAKAVGPFKDHTRRLRNSIAALEPRESGNGFAADIFVPVEYASFVENGTPPHIIRPKEGHGFIGPLQRGQSRRARTDIGTHRVALRWYEGGRPVFAAVVHHPGSRPYPFAGPALLKAEAVVIARLELLPAKLQTYWH